MSEPTSRNISSEREVILFVAAHLPIPVRGGSSQRTNILIEALQTFADVELAPIGPPDVGSFLEASGYRVAAVLPPDPSGRWWRIASVLFPRAVRYKPRQARAALVRKLWNSGRYAAVIGRYLGPSARSGVHQLPVAFVDIDDVESQKLRSWGERQASRPWLKRLSNFFADRMLDAEREVASSLSQAWFSAEEDAINLSGCNTAVIPNIPFYHTANAGPSPEHGPILFVASLDYRVNVDALDRFVSHLWPKMRERHPQARLRVIGGGLSLEALTRFAEVDGVELAGFVEDLHSQYKSSVFSIVPIWEGGGTKIKILESLAFSRTCVVASPSLRGYENVLKDGASLLKAEDEREFVEAMSRLLVDVKFRHRLESVGVDMVTANYSRSLVAQRLEAALASVRRVSA